MVSGNNNDYEYIALTSIMAPFAIGRYSAAENPSAECNMAASI